MQKLSIDTLVRARGEQWRVVGVRAYDDCQVVSVTSLAAGTSRRGRVFLLPFESLHPVAKFSRPRGVCGRTWRATCRALLAQAGPPATLRSASVAKVALWPHQLAPALAVIRGLGCRLLLADDVGLGKTIQAGLILSELLARSAIERVLILAPAGLRDQWRDELRRRFAVEATVGDAAAVRNGAAALPPSVNPWSTWPVATASIDYVKRPDILAAVAACRWDVVVVDEAHGVANSSDRHHAVNALAARASYVVLITATPHNGDQQAFESLCQLGAVNGDGLLTFRRSRADAGLAVHRRVRAVRVRLTRDERRMHDLLQGYLDAVQAERGSAPVACAVLQKRALSSAWSLAESVDRRLMALADSHGIADQLLLPLDHTGEVTREDDAPPWPEEARLADRTRDRQLLRALSVAARTAAGAESKIAALRRLLRRSNEAAVVFTEYRDTLRHVAHLLHQGDKRIRSTLVTLHGGMVAAERRAALNQFRQGTNVVLLATDAAGEGLNLHDTCRLVVNLELPWNPIRLEQRIGRVDRIGQRRTVHAVELVAADTAEEDLRQRLNDRLAFARAAVDRMADPRMNVIAADEARRLQNVRALSGGPGDDSGRPLVTTPRRRWRRQIGLRRVEIWRVAAEDGDGCVLESTVVALAVDADCGRSSDAVALATRTWRDEVRHATESFLRIRLLRERAIAARLREDDSASFQPGLFDRRHERAHLIAVAARAASLTDIEDRLQRASRGLSLTFRHPELRLVLQAPHRGGN